MLLTKSMLALVKTKREAGLTLKEIPLPKIDSDSVLIKVKATSICGTDLHIYNWDNWAQNRVKKVPLVQGHEFCGTIVKTGQNVKRLKIGDFVSAESHIVDYLGEYYQKGLGHIAPETKIIGVDTDGSFAQYIALPWQNARKNPKNMPVNIAVLKENFGNACHAAYKVNLQGKNILITGCGPVGLMTLLIAKEQKAKTIIVSDISDYRLKFAKKLGADFTHNPKQSSLSEFVNRKTQNLGVDVFLEMSGAPDAFIQGLKSVIAGGDIVIFGLFPKPVELDINSLIIFRGLTIHAVVGRKMWETWEKVEDLLDNHKVDLAKIVTNVYQFKDYKKAFAKMESGISGKVMLVLDSTP